MVVPRQKNFVKKWWIPCEIFGAVHLDFWWIFWRIPRVFHLDFKTYPTIFPLFFHHFFHQVVDEISNSTTFCGKTMENVFQIHRWNTQRISTDFPRWNTCIPGSVLSGSGIFYSKHNRWKAKVVEVCSIHPLRDYEAFVLFERFDDN